MDETSRRPGELLGSLLRIRRLLRVPSHWVTWIGITLASLALGGCSSAPLLPYTAKTPPLMLVPASQAGVVDKRDRFREIFCETLETRGTSLPDYRPCDQALVHVGAEAPATGRKVDLGPSQRRLIAVIVPGIGWDCFSNWLELKGSTAKHVRRFGYDLIMPKVDGLSSSVHNARQIRDAILQMPTIEDEPRLVLIGYSKGMPDILEAVVSYPEIRPRIAAVVSAAGAVGGSPLANDAEESQLALFRYWPGAECPPGDGGGIDSLRPGTRKTWLEKYSLPSDFPYYSLVTFPEPERISSVLKLPYGKLGRVDGRNDGQLLFYDQVVPGSTLLGYVNADHWAVSVPIARSHRLLGSTFVDHNDFPREALLEAVLRFVEEDLEQSTKPNQESGIESSRH